MWGLSFACPEGAPSRDVPKGGTAQELLSPGVPRQPLHCLPWVSVVPGPYCAVCPLGFAISIPTEDEEDSASGILSGFSVVSPPLTWSVLLKTLV